MAPLAADPQGAASTPSAAGVMAPYAPDAALMVPRMFRVRRVRRELRGHLDPGARPRRRLTGDALLGRAVQHALSSSGSARSRSPSAVIRSGAVPWSTPFAPWGWPARPSVPCGPEPPWGYAAPSEAPWPLARDRGQGRHPGRRRNRPGAVAAGDLSPPPCAASSTGESACSSGHGPARPALSRASWSAGAARFDLEVHVTVDSAVCDWRGDVGVVTTLIPRAAIDADAGRPPSSAARRS